MKREHSLPGPLHSTECKSHPFLNVFPRALTCGRRLVSILAAAATIGILGTLWSLPASAIEYIYDELGRVVGVVSPTGESARYNYDSLGNIVAIDRFGLAAISILEFTPNSGPAGTSVVINGTGFSATVAQNTVKFNGVTAAITSASTTKLIVTVPATATTGKVTVTSPAGTATSSADFVVAAGTAGMPTITSFTPTIGATGTTVTITGTNFDTGLGLTKVRFNQTPAVNVSVASMSSLTAVVPTDAASGKIRVITPAGYVDSVGDFVANVLAIDGAPSNVTLATTGQTARLTFIGSVGQNLGLGMTGSTSADVAVYRPDGARISISTCFTANPGCELNLSNLPMSGTYSVVVTGTGSYTATLSSDVTGTLTAGTPFNLTLNRAGQNGRLTFSGNAGDSLELGISGLTTSPANQNVVVMVYNPNGTLLGVTSMNIAGALPLDILPATGTYQVFIDPSLAATASVTLRLTPALQVPLTLNGPPSNVTLSTAWQSVKMIFTGSFGQNLGLGITGLTLNPMGSTSADVAVYRPDGARISISTCFTANPGCELNLSNLPMSGTYSVVVTPQAGGTGSYTTTLSSDVTGTLTAGTPFNLTLNRAGQNGRLTFSGNAGDSLELGISGLATSPANQNVVMTVYKPDGSLLSNASTSTAGTFTLGTLTGTSPYLIFIDPSLAATASMTLQLAPAPQVLLNLNGAPSNVMLSTAGQSVKMTFIGSVGQNLGLGITGLTLSPVGSTYVFVYVYAPDGSLLKSMAAYTGQPSELNLSSLPMTGTYSVMVTPTAGTTGSFTTTLSTQVSGNLLIDGSPSNLSIRAGQTARLTFTGSVGQNLGLGLTGLALSSAYVSVDVYKPDGSSLNSMMCSTFSGPRCGMNLSNLPVNGTYSVVVTAGGGAGTFTAALSSDVTGALTAGTPLNLSLSRAGQNGRLTFSGTLGDILGLALTGVTVTPASAGGGTISVYKPDGILLTTFSFFNGNITTQSMPPLPTAGIYSIMIDPSNAATASMTVLLTRAVQAPLTLDGASSNVTLGTAGQPVRLTFTGSMGQNLGLGITGLTLSPAGSTGADVTVYSPDGSQMNFRTCYTTWLGCELNLSNLPMSGTYSVVVMPQANGTGSFTATLSSDVTGALTAGTPLNPSLSRAGQNGRLTFSRNMGTSAVFMFSTSTIPAGQNVTFTVYQPNGTSFGVIPTSFAGGTLTFPSLPVTGTYTLFIDPSYAATTTMSVTLSP